MQCIDYFKFFFSHLIYPLIIYSLILGLGLLRIQFYDFFLSVYPYLIRRYYGFNLG